ncbi:putative metal-dependent membrane protease [Streptococcus pneumoniae]|nr:putative metal-dependent membrane protease [Streptococcus pneumoniae]VTE29435.1 putative metal-dependent membrane protease [Streptococcus pneumoniae]
MKRIIPVYIFQQVNVLLVSLYLLKFLCIGELTILQVLYGASLFSFLSPIIHPKSKNHPESLP